MANKSVPREIEGVLLHTRSRQRTKALIRDLEAFGVTGLVRAVGQADRIRLLATFIFNNVVAGADVPVTEKPPVNDASVFTNTQV